jgi:hypothetical protein
MDEKISIISLIAYGLIIVFYTGEILEKYNKIIGISSITVIVIAVSIVEKYNIIISFLILTLSLIAVLTAKPHINKTKPDDPVELSPPKTEPNNTVRLNPVKLNPPKTESYESAKVTPSNPEDKKLKLNVPYPDNRFFTGREKKLEQIHEALISN